MRKKLKRRFINKLQKMGHYDRFFAGLVKACNETKQTARVTKKSKRHRLIYKAFRFCEGSKLIMYEISDKKTGKCYGATSRPPEGATIVELETK